MLKFSSGGSLYIRYSAHGQSFVDFSNKILVRLAATSNVCLVTSYSENDTFYPNSCFEEKEGLLKLAHDCTL